MMTGGELPLHLDDFLQTTEKRLIVTALSDNRGHLERTAQTLGISYRSLRHRLSRYGLNEVAADLRCRKPCCNEIASQTTDR